MIYLASPYTHEDKRVEERRFWQTVEATALLISSGLIVISPIIHSHFLYKQYPELVDGDAMFWKTFNEKLLHKCDSLLVLKLDGWQDSIGIHYEVGQAVSEYKPVEFVTLEELRKNNKATLEVN